MQWRNLMARCWPALALAFLGLFGVVAIVQAAGNPFFTQATDKENEDAAGWLGVYIQDIDEDMAEFEDLPSTDGVLVSGIIDGSPAEEAGLKEGDVIVKFDGQDVRSVRRLTNMIEDTKPKTKVDIEILRDGNPRVLACQIGASDSDVWMFGDNDWNYAVPRAPRAPRAPDALDTPRPPRAYSFSLGQLSSSYIGVGLLEMSEQLAAAMSAADGGALINEIEKDSPAEKAGLKAGDVIVEIDHKKIEDNDDVRRAIQKKKDGEVATVRVLRGKNEDKTVDVTVESNDTWSGIGAPQRFRVRHDNAGIFELPDMRQRMRNSMRDDVDDWRRELEEEMRELREELKELREELRDNR
jgi:S1-C subfamily serine protease